MTKHVREEKKKTSVVDPKLREEAIKECRIINRARASENNNNATITNEDVLTEQQMKKTKGTKVKTMKSDGTPAECDPFDPSGPQLAAMIEDIRLRKSLGIDVVLENNMGNVTEEENNESDSISTSQVPSSSSTTLRVSLAEIEKKRKEKEKLKKEKEVAIAYLTQALETERERDIKDSLKFAKSVELEGKLNDGRKFCTSLMFKVIN
jgi:hypothetical protein